MADQLTLDGFEPPPRPTDRLFFAVRPDEATARRIDALVDELRTPLALKGKPLGAARYHVTLHLLGDFVGLPHEVIGAALRVGAAVGAQCFGVQFDQLLSFRRRRDPPLVLTGRGDAVAGLHALHRALGQAMQACGLCSRGGTAFVPHLTLMYDRRSMPLQPVPPLRWRVDEFVLVRSLLGQSRHELLARWPLQDGAG